MNVQDELVEYFGLNVDQWYMTKISTDVHRKVSRRKSTISVSRETFLKMADAALTCGETIEFEKAIEVMRDVVSKDNH